MKPTKRKAIVEKLAKENNISEEDLDNIIYYYYKFVASLVDSLDHHSVYIPKVGCLHFRPNMGYGLIHLYNDRIEATGTKYISDEERMETIKKIEELIRQNKEHVQKAKDLKRKKYEID